MHLGGKDWDDRIVDHVASKFIRTTARTRVAIRTLATLNAAAERAKRTLSKLSQTSITCTHAGKMLTVPLSAANSRT